ncbi:factor-independent urate hydroxylase [Nocardioides marmotae]|uniref:factor-independent urate hydroxylase n=1 Tax=Nocardioides marmotae TaxID=2663857 RepID=UPI00132192B7|nr:urate oxidase [Nocardioides marmotae]MBC9734990.1 urate oxidase [Nocardioides marmotae]MTB86090.1 urate oxidase [Nocardioides marmotae]
MAAGDVVLGENQYGKAECRLVRIDRETPGAPGGRHRITDLTVTGQLRGDFAACHTDGDNSQVVATDTQKNTLYAFARDGVGAPEELLLRLAEHFTTGFPWVSGGRWEARQHAWERIEVDGAPHDHSFVRGGRETRTALVQRDGDDVFVLAGLRDLTVLKSTGSEFGGFPRDRYTTLPETDDRILATDVTAWWRYAELPSGSGGFAATYAAVRDLLLATFADLHSLALQQTIFAMGKAVLEAFPGIAEVRLSCPNNHHFLVDLEPFGLDNPGEVFVAADRPYGLIQATVQREGEAREPRAWATVAGFA